MTATKFIFILGAIAGLGSFISCLFDMNTTCYALALVSMILLATSDIGNSDKEGPRIGH